jgi:hypothetical protein
MHLGATCGALLVAAAAAARPQREGCPSIRMSPAPTWFEDAWGPPREGLTAVRSSPAKP